MSAEGRWVASTGMMPGRAAAGDHVAVAGGELVLLGFRADGGGVVGDLIDADEVEGPAQVRGDLPEAEVQELVGAVVDLGLEPVQGVDRVINVRADEPGGSVPPQAELDPLAVDQDELAVQGQGGVRDDQLQCDGFAGAGFAAEQHVPLS